ncbi:MAG TPA: GNAT family N-acetyltransferase [Bacillota bacterium]|nr:GNAT family N-acetyltransferase [Bacillota bacterium]HPF42686.1 GNAT family N-acetyltransferase [Bacillota bacterium]HPJ86298.1 GNAT family N-acetyltransferase [Bacillota bacterium]HPQ62204.1 GNAT family N-acetyltransferase [Bacillota bacterium]HRX91915.1 GNAT family N-acetyltransferase [Candidatus Izemoplasmatales bacterium]
MNVLTQRLCIRDFKEDDFDDLWAIFKDKETMKHVRNYTKPETLTFFRSFCLSKTPPGAFAVVLKDIDKVIGYLLFNNIDEKGIYEIGWIFNRMYWREGYAYEAAKAMIKYAFDSLDAHKIVAEAEDTDKSVPLMKKLGMIQEGIFRKHCLTESKTWKDLYWYGILKDDICG